jgi:nitrous oxidase accessory protein NosD
MYTRNTLVYDNDIHNNYQCGVFLGDNFYVNITNNRIHHNSRNGIQYEFAFENSIINDNLIFDNGISGIVILWAANFKIINNTINKHSQFGISAEDDVQNLTISENFITFNENYGISLNDSTSNISISNNNLINNSGNFTSQGFDSGISNNISNNYWNDWIKPDNNSDNIVDIPYQIDGSAKNSDPYPQCYPTNFTIISPTTNVTIPLNTTEDTEISLTTTWPYLTSWLILPDLCMIAFILYFINKKQFRQIKKSD